MWRVKVTDRETVSPGVIGGITRIYSNMAEKAQKRMQLLALVPSNKGDYHITRSRSFRCPRKYNAEKLLEEALRAAGMAVESIDKEHIS